MLIAAQLALQKLPEKPLPAQPFSHPPGVLGAWGVARWDSGSRGGNGQEVGSVRKLGCASRSSVVCRRRSHVNGNGATSTPFSTVSYWSRGERQRDRCSARASWKRFCCSRSRAACAFALPRTSGSSRRHAELRAACSARSCPRARASSVFTCGRAKWRPTVVCATP